MCQAVAVGCVTALGAFCIGLLWTVLVVGPFSWNSLRDGMAWLLLPCVMIASLLSAFSLRGSRGTQLAARVLSLVLWTAGTPLVWMLCFWVWAGLTSGRWGDWLVFLFGGIVTSTAAWCLTAAPAFAVLSGRRLLRHDPGTAFGPPGPGSVHGPAEQEEDREVLSVRGVLGEVFSPEGE